MDRLSFYLYSCIVFTDSFLSVTFALQNLTVPAQLNHDVSLPCRLPINSYYGKNVRWFSRKDGWLTDGSNVNKHRGQIQVIKPAPNEWNLHIRRVTMSFEDIYTCKTGDSDVLSTIKLVIETSPRITEEDSSPIRLRVTESSLVTLKCTAIGTPEPEITWHRGLSENYIGITGPLLKIPEISRYATDEYICRARNKNGEAERRISVTVDFAPKATVMESVVYASGGEVVVMSCVVQASPLYDAYWTRGSDSNGTPLKSGWKYLVNEEEGGDSIPIKFLTLIIRKSILAPQDYGTYSCIAKGESRVAMDTMELKERQQIRKKGKH